MEMVRSLWGGTLPPFDSLDALNELHGALVMGLWNRLSKHREQSAPFRLTRIDVSATREGLAHRFVAASKVLGQEGFGHGVE